MEKSECYIGISFCHANYWIQVSVKVRLRESLGKDDQEFFAVQRCKIFRIVTAPVIAKRRRSGEPGCGYNLQRKQTVQIVKTLRQTVQIVRTLKQTVQIVNLNNALKQIVQIMNKSKALKKIARRQGGTVRTRGYLGCRTRQSGDLVRAAKNSATTTLHVLQARRGPDDQTLG